MINVEAQCLAPRPMARHRLVLLPFAGASAASFVRLANALPAGIEPYGVTLPDPRPDNWEQVIGALGEMVKSLPGGAISLMGHSLGALMALDLAQRVSRPLSSIIVSGRPWPGKPFGRDPIELNAADDAALVAEMITAYGPLPESMAHPEIAAAAMPLLRADLTLLQQYRYRGPAGLECPLTVLTGTDDPITATSSPSLWQAETSGKFAALNVPGGHYFVVDKADEVAALLAERLT